MSSYFIPKNCANDTLYSLIDEEVIAEVNAILNGGTISPNFVNVTISNELIFSNSGFLMRIKPTTLSGSRSLTIPDAGGELVVAGAVQDITSKLYQARQGSASSPSYAFDLFPTTGIYNDGINSRLHFSVNGVETLRLNQNETITYNPIEAQNGSSAVPSYSFASNRDVGLFYDSKAITINTSIDNSTRLTIGATITTHSNQVRLTAGSVLAPALTFGSLPPAATTGLFYESFSTIGFASNGTEIARISGSGLTVSDGRQIIAPGSAGGSSETSPAIFFNESATHGIYTTSGNELSFTVNSVRRMFLSSSQQRNTIPIRCNDGSVSAPSFAFASETNTGIYRSGTATLSIACGGSERLRIGTNLGVSYNAGGTQVSFQRSDLAYGAATLAVDASNDFNISNTSGSRTINLNTNNGEVVVANGTNIRSQESYDDTTATAANLVVDSSGLFLRSTSSIKYKKNIEDFTGGLDMISLLKPITYSNKFKTIKREEEMISRDGKKEMKYIKEKVDDDSGKRYAGFIAESLDEAKLNLFVSYNDKGEPDNVEYSRIVVLLVNCIKELKERLEVLEENP
jgi:hypothetical protein